MQAVKYWDWNIPMNEWRFKVSMSWYYTNIYQPSAYQSLSVHCIWAFKEPLHRSSLLQSPPVTILEARPDLAWTYGGETGSWHLCLFEIKIKQSHTIVFSTTKAVFFSIISRVESILIFLKNDYRNFKFLDAKLCWYNCYSRGPICMCRPL